MYVCYLTLNLINPGRFFPVQGGRSIFSESFAVIEQYVMNNFQLEKYLIMSHGDIIIKGNCIIFVKNKYFQHFLEAKIKQSIV